MLSKYVWDNIAQENYLCNIGPERTDVFLQENNLRNVVALFCLGQHCTKQLPTPCRQCWLIVDSLVNIFQIRWDNTAQENYYNVGPERADILSQENRLFQICLVGRFLTGYNITKQSWLFLFNVGSGVHLRLAGQQWTGADTDKNILRVT